MARSQFSFVIAVPDSTTKELKVVGTNAQVKIRYRNPDLSSANYDSPGVKIYSSEDATSPSVIDGVVIPDANGRVSGWLEDGRYSITVTSTATPVAFSPIVQNFDIRSGGEFKISKGGVPDSPNNPQIFFDDDTSGGNPSIKLGSGSGTPDVVISRSGTNALTIDSASSGSLSTTIVGDVKLSSSSKTLDVNDARIQNTGSPVLSSDAATKGYVDANNTSVESTIYNGRIHNMPLLTKTDNLSAVTSGDVNFTKISPFLNTNVSAIEFVRGGTTSNSVTFQFALFAEYNDFAASPVRRMVCLSSSPVITETWTAKTAKELPLGVFNKTLTNGTSSSNPTTLVVDSTADFASSGSIYVGTTLATYSSKNETSFIGVSGISGTVSNDTSVTQFAEEPFFYGDWVLEANFTGNIYAGIVTTGSNAAISLLGTIVAGTSSASTSIILAEDLGLSAENQFPYFAGKTTPSSAITIAAGSVYYRGADTSFQILGSLASTGNLPTTGNVGDAYIISQALHIYNGSSWIDQATVIDFPSSRSASIPFARIKV
jgi:hypothetical protein